MFVFLFIAHASIGGLMFGGGLLGAVLALRLADRPSQGRMLRNVRICLWLLLSQSVLLTLALLTGLWFFIGYRVAPLQGWFVAAMVEVGLLYAAVDQACVPRLFALRRRLDSGAAVPDRAARAAAADPGLVGPLTAVPIGLGAVAYLMTMRPAPLQSALFAALTLLSAAVVRWAGTWPGRGSSAAFTARRLRIGPLATVLVLAVGGWTAWSWQSSKLPSSTGMAGMGPNSMAGMAMSGEGMAGMAMPGATSVATLAGPGDGAPDASFELTVREQATMLASGARVNALTVNDTMPGPTLVVHQGDLVQVRLVDAAAVPVTLHWHGLNVPGGEDGVPGVTQDAVAPGGSFAYRFRVDQVGTFWYHSHQDATTQIARGLFGAVVVLPRSAAPQPLDVVLASHLWPTDRGDRFAFGPADGSGTRAVAAGTPVRLRIINTDDKTETFALGGTDYRVAALDGTDLAGPTAVRDLSLSVPAGGRMDLTFTMPSTPVVFQSLDHRGTSVLVKPTSGTSDTSDTPDTPDRIPAVAVRGSFDPLHYGVPAAGSTAGSTSAVTASSHFDETYHVDLDQRMGFYDGRFSPNLYLINGALAGAAPPFVVHTGDLVKLVFTNRTVESHPFHLHGHHMVVLSKNGSTPTGSPVWLDTLDVKPGDTWTVAFRADNPGIWMFHCHNLPHAAMGMMSMIVYEGVSTPFRSGPATHNDPAG